MPHCNKQMISFFLTTKCDLRCTYCYNSKERESIQEISLSLEIAKAGLDDYFLTDKSRHLRFYGPGEPTQEFNLMCDIVEYAKNITENTITTEIQTNGAFSKKVRSWILDNINILWISFDGTPDIQNAQRPLIGNKPSSPIIENNINWLIANRNDRDLMVGARVTITDLNVNRQIEMVDYFDSLGIKYVWTDPIFHSVNKKPVCKDIEKINKYKFDMDSYVKGYIDAYKYAKGKSLFYGSFLTCNFDGEAEINCRACTPVPHLTPDGYVSACDMVVFGDNAYHMDCFIYGKWDQAGNRFIYYEEKINALQNRNVDNMAMCGDCEVKLHCGGHCLGEVVNETGKLYGQIPVVCKAIRKLYKELGVCDIYDYLHP